MALASKVERAFGKRLPLVSFIHAPTIQQFSELISPTTAVRPLWSCLVKLSAGGPKRPLFLMHSHGGNILEYYSLAHRLGRDRSVYALQARGLDGKSFEEHRIEEMAAHYLKEIRSVQPHGPYYLGGYCLGGMLALEAAQQLHAQNEEVDLLVMMNTSTRDYPRYPLGTTHVRRGLLCRIGYRFALEFDNLLNKTASNHVFPRASTWQASERCLSSQGRNATGCSIGWTAARPRKHSLVYQLERLAMDIDRAGMVYRPRPYDGKVLLLNARRQPLGIVHDRRFGWEGLLTGEFQVQEVPGFRQNMLDEPNTRGSFHQWCRMH